jgi:hypothetical protein
MGPSQQKLGEKFGLDGSAGKAIADSRRHPPQRHPQSPARQRRVRAAGSVGDARDGVSRHGACLQSSNNSFSRMPSSRATKLAKVWFSQFGWCASELRMKSKRPTKGP